MYDGNSEDLSTRSVRKISPAASRLHEERVGGGVGGGGDEHEQSLGHPAASSRKVVSSSLP